MKKSLKTFSRRAAGLEGAEVEAAVEAGLARDVDDDLKKEEVAAEVGSCNSRLLRLLQKPLKAEVEEAGI